MVINVFQICSMTIVMDGSVPVLSNLLVLCDTRSVSEECFSSSFLKIFNKRFSLRSVIQHSFFHTIQHLRSTYLYLCRSDIEDGKAY